MVSYIAPVASVGSAGMFEALELTQDHWLAGAPCCFHINFSKWTVHTGCQWSSVDSRMSVIKCSRSARDEISVIKCWRCSVGRVWLWECCQDTWGTCCEDLLFPVSIVAPKSVQKCCLWRNSDERCWFQRRFGFLHVCEPPVQSCLLRSLVSSIFWSLPCSAVAVESLKKKEDIHVCCFGLFSLKVSLKTHCNANPRKFGSVAIWLILHLKTCTSATPVHCCPCCGKQSQGGVHKLQLWLKATLTWERRPSQMGHPYLKITVFRKCPFLVPDKWPPHYSDHACLRVCGLVAFFFISFFF